MIDDPLNRSKAKRGSQLPWAKLNEGVVRQIHEAVAKREAMDAERKKYTNAALAEKYGVHVKTIDKITAMESWAHVIEGQA